ncbi:MAG: glycosyltransferase [Patescibacteria group bacterium]
MRKEKIRVVFALPSFVVGGTERQLLKQMRVYDYEMFDVSLFTFFEYPDKKTLYHQLPPEVKVVRLTFTSNLDFAMWRKLFASLRRAKPHVVVSSAFWANTIFRLLKPFFGYTSITREHNTYIEKNFFQKVIDHVLSYMSYRIIAISAVVAEFASKQACIPLSKFLVILNGVDVDEIEHFRVGSEEVVARLRAELGLTKEKKIVLNVGRLKPQKNQALLIEGFLTFHKENPEYVLVILGDGIERSNLERLLSLRGGLPFVKLLGHRDDAYAFYAAADIFVLSSRHEGGPNAVLEAIAFGLPVLSTRIAGVNEYIREGINGFFIEHTPESVATTLAHVAHLSVEKRNSVAQEAQKTAKGFSIEKVAEKYMNVLEEAAENI